MSAKVLRNHGKEEGQEEKLYVGLELERYTHLGGYKNRLMYV